MVAEFSELTLAVVADDSAKQKTLLDGLILTSNEVTELLSDWINLLSRICKEIGQTGIEKQLNELVVLADSSRNKFHAKVECAYRELMVTVTKNRMFQIDEHGLKVGNILSEIGRAIDVFEADSPELIRPKIQRLMKTEK